MKQVFVVALFAASFAMVGCDTASGPSNVAEGLNQSAVDEYNAALAADEALMNESSDDDVDDGAAPAPAAE